MNMNKKIFLFIITLFGFFFVKNNVYAETCSYKSKDGKTTVTYETIDKVKKSWFSSNENIEVKKYQGKSVNKKSNGNQSANNYTIDKCYEYISIGKSGSGYLYKLGNTLDEISGTSEVLKLNGFDKESNENMCEYTINKNTNYNNKLNAEALDLDIKSTYQIHFRFNTLSDGSRKFTITYDGVTYGNDNVFTGTNIPTISTGIKRQYGDQTVSFTVNSSNVDDFFNCNVNKQYLNIKRDGNSYTLYAEKVNNSSNESSKSNSSNGKCPDGYVSKDGITCVSDSNGNVADKPCQENDMKKVFRLFGYLLLIAKICIPLIIIIMGSLDIFKAVYGQDDKALGKQLKILVWRIIGGLTIFFLPTIVNAFFKVSSDIDVSEDEDYKICVNCLLDPLNKQICSVNENEYDSNNNVSKITSTTTTTKRVHGGKGDSY
mgnify:CR=1 FL=1